jgi:hypothetical protein
MKKSFALFVVSVSVLFLAWIAKMHFVFGGDYLFRLGTVGIIISFIIQAALLSRAPDVMAPKLTRLFFINSALLGVVYLGMMMKVSHIMNTQLEKDLVLDFAGIPAILAATIYNFLRAGDVLEAPIKHRLLFYQHIWLPWLLFVFSFILYAVYSVILTRI